MAMTSGVWVRTWKYCPYGGNVPNPLRAFVEVGYQSEDERFVATSAHLMVDVTDKRLPRLEIPLAELDKARREHMHYGGGGWTRTLASMPDWMRREYGV